MSLSTRALVIGLAGTAIQLVGILWLAGHVLVSHLHDPISARHMVFEPPFLTIFVGFLVTFVTIPVALEVARATPEEVAIPVFTPDDPEQFEPLEAAE
jgi:hypothetical protein